MNLIDIIWNLFRKLLGNNIYKKLQHSPLGRPNNYYSISTYKDIFEHYKKVGTNFKSKRILEIGCGKQFYTAFYFLSEGAESVSLVDPVFMENPNSTKDSQLEEFQKNSNGHTVSLSKEINYYSSLDSIPENFNEKFDFLCSHFVLEHFDNLDNYFYNTSRLLSSTGLAYNFVDLSDHAYHLFDSRPWTKWIYKTRMLYHLRYSDSFYNFITDKRIWVNRFLLSAYKELASKYHLEILRIEPQLYHKVKIHKDVLERNHPNNQDLYITHFSILLKKP